MNHIKPGGWVRVIQDGECLKINDKGCIFSIEKGTDPYMYAIYCFEKGTWEYFFREQIK